MHRKYQSPYGSLSVLNMDKERVKCKKFDFGHNLSPFQVQDSNVFNLQLSLDKIRFQDKFGRVLQSVMDENLT